MGMMMNKAQETKARRAAVLSILGGGWKGEKGIEGARDMYTFRRDGKSATILPQRTVEGNFYVGAYDHKAKRYLVGRSDVRTIEEAATIANALVR
jgi:hypothetical protein